MKPAREAKRLYEKTKLLVFNREKKVEHSSVGSLVERFSPGDLLIVNRSATLPSAFSGFVERSQKPVEIRLASFIGPDPGQPRFWYAVAFSEGDWRKPTEERVSAPSLVAGDVISVSKQLHIKVNEIVDSRLLKIEFVVVYQSVVQQSLRPRAVEQEPKDKLLSLLYGAGKPIQYSYLREDLEVWDQQTIFSGPPVSVESPSASFNLNWRLVFELQKKGVNIASIIHSAGLSSTGDPCLDQQLPLPEYYEIPEETARLHQKARLEGKRVIAAGTTVLRALESAYSAAYSQLDSAHLGAGSSNGVLTPGRGLAEIKIHPGDSISAVDELITGMHEPESSHMRILKAFCPLALLENGYRQAEEKNYFGHEYGDISLVQCGCS